MYTTHTYYCKHVHFIMLDFLFIILSFDSGPLTWHLVALSPARWSF